MKVVGQEDFEGWLGYAFVLVAPNDNQAVVRVRSRQYVFSDFPAPNVAQVFDKTLNLQER